MATADKIINVSQLRAQLSHLIAECARRGQRFQISTNSEVEAVLVGITEWKMLNETLDILADRELIEQIKRSETDIQEGATEPAEDVFKALENECDQG